MEGDLKIVFAGPMGSGKSEIADVIATGNKTFQGNLKPTGCCRIVEITSVIESFGLKTNVSAQIWDTSGDERYSSAWPAVIHDCDGVVLAYSGWDKNSARDVEKYAKSFAKDLPREQVLVLACDTANSEGKPVKPRLPKSLEDCRVSVVSPAASLDDFVIEFKLFLERANFARKKKMEAKERELLGHTET
jgi:hypothetical protein